MFYCHFLCGSPEKVMVSLKILSPPMEYFLYSGVMGFDENDHLNIMQKITPGLKFLLLFMPRGRVRGMGGIGKHENGNMSVSLNLKAAD